MEEEGQTPPAFQAAPATPPSPLPQPAATSAAPSDASKNTTPSPAKRNNTRSKIILIILIILGIVIAGLIIYFVLRGVGVIKAPVDLTNVTTTSLNKDVSDFGSMTYEEQAEVSTELKDKTVAYSEKLAKEKGEYDVETIRANLSVSDYYYTATDFSTSEEYLKSKIEEIDKIENPSNDQIEAKILYGTTLFQQYLNTGQTSKAADVYDNILKNIPEDAVMHENNWSATLQVISMQLAEKQNNSEEDVIIEEDDDE